MRVIATDPYRWIGFSNDPAEVEGWCLWLRLGHWHGLYLSQRGLEVTSG